MRTFSRLVLLSFTAALAGCGPQVTAPSLEVRPIESRPIALPAEASEPQVAADPALVASLAAAMRAAEAGDRAFADACQAAERAITAARGAAPESEAWTAAQQALSAVEAPRGPVRDASVTIDAARQDPANAGSGARAAIDEAARQVQAMEDREAATVAALSARLR